MAVLLEQVMPEGIDLAMVDEVTAQMDVANHPPPGLVAHVHWFQDGRTRIVDIWETSAAYETFRTNRLGPAMEKVTQQRGVTVEAEPDTTITEVDTLVRGPASLKDAVTTRSKDLVGRLSQEVNKRRGGAKP